MAISTADFKNGMCIINNGKMCTIVEFQHVKPGKGPAFVRTKLKNLESGRVLDNTFSAGAKIEPVRVERRPYQFTYEDDLGAHFMHTETFEEINIDKNLITNYDLMADGQIVETGTPDEFFDHPQTKRAQDFLNSIKAVSYTHLTLPTT